MSPPPASLGWLPLTTFLLCILGLADSAYQAYTDLTSGGLLGCSARADACVLVQDSVYAHVLGIPVAVLGVAFYAFMTVICSPPAWRSAWPAVHRVRLAAVVTGMLFVLYLIYREVITLGQICPYCTSVHVITFGLFALVVYSASARDRPHPRAPGPAADGEPVSPRRPGTARRSQ
jgi:uncharacterized membrane protein